MVGPMRASTRLTHRCAATERRAGDRWNGAAVPAVLHPACWWALLVGAPPAASS